MTIQEQIVAARVAQAAIKDYTQEQIDKLVYEVAKIIYKNAEPLAREAVDETRLGCYEDKIAKNTDTPATFWAYLKDKKSVGIISEDAVSGVMEIAHPIGVIGAITPATNPTVTPLGNFMHALKGKNALVVCPAPRAQKTSTDTINRMRQALVANGAPADLVQAVEEPTLEHSAELMAECDLVLATGAFGLTKAAYSSGTPAYGVGPGNPPVVLDRGYDLTDAVKMTITAVGSDNGILCDGDNMLLHPAEEEKALFDTMRREGVVVFDKPEDVDKVLQYDGEGIGLFRTEFLFMDRNAMPTEEEQFEAYKKVAAAMNGKPVIIRTLDIGGDKEIPYMGLEKDETPFLGYRAIRFCLDRREDVYKPQLRALLRASAFGNIRIMVPLVTCIEEYRQAKALVEEIKKELDEKGIAYNKDIQVGIMVETAAASLIADIFAKEADFFSIGTNDLTQYTMSVDRGNKKVSYLYSTFNPAVLRSIKHIIACGREAGIMVGMCGEAASDPMMIPLLLAFGLNEFSMSASAILKARKMVTQYSVEELQAVADKAMSFATTAETEQYMRDFVEKVTD